MKIYGQKNVFDAALDRLRWLYKEFPNVVCAVSGGKDSTVVFHLTLQVARELNRLPLKVLFIDQEAEWQATIDQIRATMEHPDVEPMWFQVPILLSNATSTVDHWLHCWDPKEEYRWMRPKESYAYTENKYGTNRFKELFPAIMRVEFPSTRTAKIGGIRCEESPVRLAGLSKVASYKWVTWGNHESKALGHYTFYPIYDWSYADVWAAIHRNKWRYNRIYDVQFSRGISIRNMRVSNVHHETAVGSLFYMQEAEPETYAKLTQRIHGVDMAGKLGREDYFSGLPFMFRDMAEYRDFLVDRLITNPKWRRKFKKRFAKDEIRYGPYPDIAEKMRNVHVRALLTNDHEHVKAINFANEATRILRQTGRRAWGRESR